jgi:hypothetical protein
VLLAGRAHAVPGPSLPAHRNAEEHGAPESYRRCAKSDFSSRHAAAIPIGSGSSCSSSATSRQHGVAPRGAADRRRAQPRQRRGCGRGISRSTVPSTSLGRTASAPRSTMPADGSSPASASVGGPADERGRGRAANRDPSRRDDLSRARLPPSVAGRPQRVIPSRACPRGRGEEIHASGLDRIAIVVALHRTSRVSEPVRTDRARCMEIGLAVQRQLTPALYKGRSGPWRKPSLGRCSIPDCSTSALPLRAAGGASGADPPRRGDARRRRLRQL